MKNKVTLSKKVWIRGLLQRSDLTKAQKIERLEAMEYFLNTDVLATDDGSEGQLVLKAKVVRNDNTITLDDQEVGGALTMASLAIGGKRADLIFGNLAPTMLLMFTREELLDPVLKKLHDDILDIITRCDLVFKNISSKAINYDIHRLLELQNCIDTIGTLWVKLFGGGQITNYFHLMFSGHVRDFLLKCGGTLFYHQNQAWEGKNSQVKQFVWRKSQRGGSAGNGGSKDKVSEKVNVKHESIMSSVMRFATRLFVYRLYNVHDGSLAKRIKDYEDLRKQERNEIRQANRAHTAHDEDDNDDEVSYTGD
jgi:hypothetical protein